MKKASLFLSVFFLIMLLLSSCDDSGTKVKTEENNKERISLNKDNKRDEATIPVVNLSKKEALELIKAFIKENPKKYSEYGDLQDITTIGGNYSKEGAVDYFYTIDFYPGGDFVYPTHFFYNSESKKILELSMLKSIDFIRSIEVKEIKQGKLIGTAIIWGALSGEHVAFKSVKAEFKLDGDKITCDKKFLPLFKKAQKDVQNELEEMERMMNADGVNSSEDEDF